MKSIKSTFQSLILIVLTICSLTVISQQAADYQLFRQDGTYFYHENEAWNSSVVGVRLDSSALTSEGTEWFSHRSVFSEWIMPEMDQCYHPDGPSWMGWKLLVKPNGDNMLFGRHAYDVQVPISDTILIKTRALPGDSWCYIHAGVDMGPDTVATVTRMDTMTFMGITDSIKVINFGVDSVILSKQHGLVRALNFRDFIPGYNYESYDLTGITSEDTTIGTRLLKYGDIYDYEIGDVFHRSRHISTWPYATMYDVYEVLDKTYSENHDTLFYQLSDINWFVGPEGTSDPEYDTLTETYTDLDAFVTGGSLPNETTWDPEWGMFYEMWMYSFNDMYYGRPWITGPYETFYGSEPPDSCYYSMGTYSCTYYIKGCGDLMHLYDDMHNCAPCEELNYYQKGGEEWGTPFTIPTGIGEWKELPVKIYPVPADDYLIIEIDWTDVREPIKVTLSDISGRVVEVFDIHPDHSSFRIDIRNLKKGIYFLKLSGGNRVAVKKIVH